MVSLRLLLVCFVFVGILGTQATGLLNLRSPSAGTLQASERWLHANDVAAGTRVHQHEKHSETEKAVSWDESKTDCRYLPRFSPFSLALLLVACFACASAIHWLIWDWATVSESAQEASNLMGQGELVVDETGKTIGYQTPGGAMAEVNAEGKTIRSQIPWQQFLAIAYWLMLLTANAALTRLVCNFGVPHDCHDRVDLIRGLDSYDRLLKDGFIIAVLTGINHRDRFRYLFDFSKESWFRGIWFIGVFMLTSPVFGSLDLIPALSRLSLTTGGHQSILFNILIVLLVLGAAALIGLHIAWAFMYNSPIAGTTYIVSRAVVWLVYIIYFVEANNHWWLQFHLHHFMIGYMIAILAEFNHPISVLLLAIGSGIFVQGLAAYAADPLIYRQAHL